jgi:oligopeptide transport system substrate-binding protein
MEEKVAEAYMPPGFFEGWQSTPAPAFDIEGAKKLLAEAGYPDGVGFPQLRITYNSNNPARREFTQFLAETWKKHLNVPISVNPLDQTSYRTYITEKQYTIGAVAWYGDYMDPSTFTDKYHSKSDNNDSNWGPPEYDDLLLAGANELDPKKRLEILMRAEAMINTDLPIIPLYHYVNLTMHRDDVKGLVANAKNLIVWKEVDLVR